MFLNWSKWIESGLNWQSKHNTIRMQWKTPSHEGLFSWLLWKYYRCSGRREINVDRISIYCRHPFIEHQFCARHQTSPSPKHHPIILKIHWEEVLLASLYKWEPRSLEKRSKLPEMTRMKQQDWGRVGSQVSLSLSPHLLSPLSHSAPGRGREHLCLPPLDSSCFLPHWLSYTPHAHFQLQCVSLCFEKHNLFSQTDQIENTIVCLNTN